MASVPVESLTPVDLSILSCTYASLILHEEGMDITVTQVEKLLKKANLKIDGFWVKMFVSTMHGRNFTELLTASSTGSSAGGSTE